VGARIFAGFPARYSAQIKLPTYPGVHQLCGLYHLWTVWVLLLQSNPAPLKQHQFSESETVFGEGSKFAGSRIGRVRQLKRIRLFSFRVSSALRRLEGENRGYRETPNGLVYGKRK
jgi:hypothetical protein